MGSGWALRRTRSTLGWGASMRWLGQMSWVCAKAWTAMALRMALHGIDVSTTSKADSRSVVTMPISNRR